MGRFVARRYRWILCGGVSVAIVAAVFGASVEKQLSTGGFADPNSESSRASAALQREFHTGVPNVVVLVTARRGSVDDPAVAAAGRALAGALGAETGVSSVTSYWEQGRGSALRSSSGEQALIVAFVPGDADTVREVSRRLTSRYQHDSALMSVAFTGSGVVASQVSDQSARDLRTAEIITAPIVAIMLLLIFRGLVAAALPLMVGGFAVIGTLLILRVLSSFTEVSVFAINITTGLGLGLGIDYSLFMVSRYQEELDRGRTADAALDRTLQTAGRTVLFSAITVAVALASMLVFPLTFLHSFAYAGVAVVALAALGAILLLPAIIKLIGPRIELGALPRLRKRSGADRGFWYRRARWVMERPLRVVVFVTLLLLALGAPVLHIAVGDDDARVLSPSASANRAATAIRAGFPGNEGSPVVVVTDGRGPATGDLATIAAYAASLSGLPDVARVDAATGHYSEGRRIAAPDPGSTRFTSGSGAWFSVVSSVEPVSPAGEALLHRIRALTSPFPVLVGGSAAALVDAKASVATYLPYALGIIAVATFVLLFLMVGSLLVPVKALVLNVLSLAATFGALVFVFQDGHLSTLLDFTPTGTVGIRIPVLLVCLAFGLSMDYEVFLLSRIKESYDVIGDNEEAVAVGLEQTGGIVTAAALLLAVVLGTFMTSGITTIKAIGLGVTLALLVDAFLIRTALVPAFMKLAGGANWWAPRPLRRLHLLVGIWEPEDLAILDVVARSSRDVAGRRRE
ncbi:MAG: transporter [Candidatus Nephthysia bennettiae]|nr:MAG: transporter [Candidatus Dormibacteraeota bacterium]